MSEERRKILELLSAGKITTDEAERLLNALGKSTEPEPAIPASKTRLNYLMINVHAVDRSGQEKEKVNIRVPFQVLRAGIKLASLMPSDVKGKVHNAFNEKGIDIDLDNIKPEDIEELINALGDMAVEVKDDNDTIRIYCA